MIASRFGAVARGGAILREREIVRSGIPQFSWSKDSGCPDAWLDSDPLKRKFKWPQEAVPIGSVGPMESFTFQFLEPTFLANGPLVLTGIRQGDQQLYDASICTIHREKMHRMVVKVEPLAPTPIEETLFINCGRFATPNPSGKTTAWVCDSCLRERDRWLEHAKAATAVSL